LDSSRLKVRQARLHEMKPKPAASELAFGKIFTDHMLSIDWSRDRGWHDPEIKPFENFSIHPGSKVR
jgi:branched-chain amino acid aminotransferase